MGLRTGRLVSAAVAAAMGLVVTQGVSGADQAQAACTVGMGRWFVSENTPHFGSSIPSTWNATVTAAMSRWNGIPGSTLDYRPPQFNSAVTNADFQIHQVSLSSVGLPDVPGLADGSQVPNHKTVRIALSSDFSWNTAGVMDQVNRMADVETILVHEVGHASGLAHPAVCGAGRPTTAEQAGVMFVTWTTKHIPSTDEKAAIAARY